MSRSLFRRYLIQGLCVAALGSAGGFYAFSSALGQKGNVFDPDTQWSVSQIGGQGLEGDSYCAVARRFEHNAILTIARNAQGESSLAVDFQTPQFPANHALPVTLDPGAGEQRQFDVQPVSGAAFVVRLGADTKFFESLTRTGLLRVETLGQSYHFNLADLDKGEFKLNGCVNDLPQPLPVAQAVAPPPAMPVESVQSESVQGVPLESAAIQAQPLPPLAPPARADLTSGERRAYEQKIEKMAADLIVRDAKIAELSRLGMENKRLLASLKEHEAMRQHVASLENEVQLLRTKLSSPQAIEPSAGKTVVASSASVPPRPSTAQATPVKMAKEENTKAVPVPPVESAATQGVTQDTAKDTAQDPAQGEIAAANEGESAAQRYEEQLRAGLNKQGTPEPITTLPAPSAPTVPPAVAKAEPTEPAPVKEDLPEVAAKEPPQDLVKQEAVKQEVVKQDVAPPAPAPVHKPLASPSETDRFAFQELLVKAALTPRDGIVPVKAGTVESGRKAYQWRSGNAFGSGEVGQATSAQAFEESIKTYLERTQKRCEGDFAVVPEQSVDAKGMRLDSYEVACMGKTMDSSVALIFIHQGDTFAAMAHEGPSAQLQELMSMRDKLISAAQGS